MANRTLNDALGILDLDLSILFVFSSIHNAAQNLFSFLLQIDARSRGAFNVTSVGAKEADSFAQEISKTADTKLAEFASFRIFVIEMADMEVSPAVESESCAAPPAYQHLA